MNDRTRRPARLMSVVLVTGACLIVSGCGQTTPSAAPTSRASAGPTMAPTVSAAPGTSATPISTPAAKPTATPTAKPTAKPTAEPTADPTSTPTSAPDPTAPAAAACPIAPQTGRLPSDRMTDIVISSSGTADFVTFVFGRPSLQEPPQGPSDGSLEAAIPPYSHAASGLPIAVTGEHVAQVRFSGMSIVNDVGEPTYDGATDFRPDLPALRTVVNYDMFEGVVGWYIGYDGNGCVTLTSRENSVTVAIDHSPS